MATKQKSVDKTEKAPKEEKPVSLKESRQTIAKEPKLTFAERTKVSQPWLKDGEQVNS